MKSHSVHYLAVVASAAAAVVTIAGCTSESPQKTDSPAVPAVAQTPLPSAATVAESAETDDKGVDEVHPHKPGSHGGIIIPIGSDSYHAEAVIEKSGDFRLLMLGKDETRIQEVDIQPIKAYVKVVGTPDATPVDMSATQQEGDAADMTSQFVGKLPEEFRGRQLDVTIPNLRIEGERFRIGFTTVTETHADEMPTALPDDEERKLYLTAGGKYTEADIKANGNITASQKFKGVASSHDMFPKKGDRICPITLTKANADFTWIIDGKPYQFCCPPCVDEFVKLAKEQPDEIKDPDSYIKAEAKK
ncbi:MAG: hypothetical protein WKF77_22590 [Planctomycetaceae bacterium]